MGICAYCGKSAGFLRSRHKRCEEGHRRAVPQIVKAVMARADGGAEAGGLAEVDKLLARSGVDPAASRRTVVAGWEAAVEAAFADGVLSESEESALVELADRFGLAQDALDGNGAWTRVVQGSVLRDVLDGEIPEKVQVDGHLPFNLQKSERLVWLFRGVNYLEDRTRTRYVGGSQGVSVRVARGLYYRTGAFKGERVQSTETVYADTGLLGATTKHLYFAGPNKGFRIRYDRIVAFEPYSDGIGVQRDAASARPQRFMTGDGWFAYNLVVNLARM